MNLFSTYKFSSYIVYLISNGTIQITTRTVVSIGLPFVFSVSNNGKISIQENIFEKKIRISPNVSPIKKSKIVSENILKEFHHLKLFEQLLNTHTILNYSRVTATIATWQFKAINASTLIRSFRRCLYTRRKFNVHFNNRLSYSSSDSVSES